jgi:hypothetical protein
MRFNLWREKIVTLGDRPLGGFKDKQHISPTRTRDAMKSILLLRGFDPPFCIPLNCQTYSSRLRSSACFTSFRRK